jgi:hypothetical protein
MPGPKRRGTNQTVAVLVLLCYKVPGLKHLVEAAISGERKWLFLRPLPGNLDERFAALSLLTAVRHRQTAGLDDGRRGMLCPQAPGCNQRGERVADALLSVRQ